MTEISTTELARQLSDFVNRVTWRGEEFIIMRGGKPVATLSPVPSGTRVCDLPGILSTLPPLPPTDLEEFEKDVTNIRRDHNQQVLDPWQS